MEITIKGKNGLVSKKLIYRKTGANFYAVILCDKEIGMVYKADGQVKKFHNHRLNGSKFVDRWFAKTPEGVRLGPKSPYDEGFASRREATIELIEAILRVRRDSRMY